MKTKPVKNMVVDAVGPMVGGSLGTGGPAAPTMLMHFRADSFTGSSPTMTLTDLTGNGYDMLQNTGTSFPDTGGINGREALDLNLARFDASQVVQDRNFTVIAVFQRAAGVVSGIYGPNTINPYTDWWFGIESVDRLGWYANNTGVLDTIFNDDYAGPNLFAGYFSGRNTAGSVNGLPYEVSKLHTVHDGGGTMTPTIGTDYRKMNGTFFELRVYDGILTTTEHDTIVDELNDYYGAFSGKYSDLISVPTVVCIGDSVEAGREVAANLPVNLQGNIDGVDVWDGTALAVLNADTTNNNQLGESASLLWGPEMEYARRYVELHSTEQTYLVKYAASGTTANDLLAAATSWTPDAQHTTAVGDLGQLEFYQAWGKAGKRGHLLNPVGVLMCLGSNDAFQSEAAVNAFQAAMDEVERAWTQGIFADPIPVILLEMKTTATDTWGLRAEQAAWVASSSGYSSSRTLLPGTFSALDSLHADATGNVTIGAAAAALCDAPGQTTYEELMLEAGHRWHGNGSMQDPNGDLDGSAVGTLAYTPFIPGRVAFETSLGYVNSTANPLAASFTMACWAKETSPPAGNVTRIFGRSGGGMFSHDHSTASFVESFAFLDNAAWESDVKVPTPINKWVHLAVSVDDTVKEYSVYINGVPVGPPVTYTSWDAFAGQTLQVGFQNFTGAVAEAVHFSRVLTADEIATLATLVTTDGLPVGDEELDGPLTFTTIDDLHVMTSAPDFTSDWSIAARVTAEDLSGDVAVFGINQNNASHYSRVYPFGGPANGVELIAGGFTQGVDAVRHPNYLFDGVAEDQEFHYCITWEAAANQSRLYINGVEVTGGVSTMSAPVNWPLGISLGSRRVLGVQRHEMLLTGGMRDVKFFDSLLTPADVKLLNEADFPNVLTLRDNDEYISFGDDDKYTFNTGGTDDPFAISCKVRFGSNVGLHGLFGKKASGSLNEWIIYQNAAGISFIIYSDNTTGNYIRYECPAIVDVDEWMSLVFTYDGSESHTGMTVYKNGAVFGAPQTTLGTYNGIQNTSAALEIARWDSGTDFDGRMSDFRLFTQDLSLANAQFLHDGSGSDPGSANLLIHLPLDGDVLDISGNGNDGTPNGLDAASWIDKYTGTGY